MTVLSNRVSLPGANDPHENSNRDEADEHGSRLAPAALADCTVVRQIAAMPWEAILWGIALAATAGLRLFMPFLFVGVMGRYASVPTPDMLDWTTTDAGILLLFVATVLEVLGDKIPVVDHALDAAATFLKPAAGLMLPVALLYDFSPMTAWTLGIVAGGPLALGVHSTKAGTRALSTTTTVGVANPVLSFLEDALAIMLLVFTVVAPLVAAILVVLLAVMVIKAWRVMRRALRPAAPAPPG